MLLIVPQRPGGRGQLGPRHAEGNQQAQPQGNLPLQPEQEEAGQKARHGLCQFISEVDQSVGPGVHPQEDHGIVLVPGGVKEAGIHVRAHQGQKKQDMQMQPKVIQ